MSSLPQPADRRRALFGRQPMPTSESFEAEREAEITSTAARWGAVINPNRQAVPSKAELDRQRRATTTHSNAAGSLASRALLASAVRVTDKTVESSAFRKTTHEAWQDDAWAMYDLVGELRFVATTLAQRTGKARLYVGQINDDPASAPDPVQDKKISGLLEAIGDGHVGLGRLIERLTLNLFVPGDGWLVGIPKALIQAAAESDEAATPGAPQKQLQKVDRTPSQQKDDAAARAKIGPDGEELGFDEKTLDDLDWRMLSISEIQFLQGQQVKLRLGPADTESVVMRPDDVYMIRVWRSHPRFWWQADSPTRSSLPVLRELVGLTMHVSAQVDSRLAGAGLLLVPAGASRAMKIAAGLPEDSLEDPFAESLMDTMLTPISDRSNASALVPMIATVPDGLSQEFQHITFDKPLDGMAQELREEAIRRLALGLDAPPELLLGTSDSNHWGAWLVQEEVVSAHIEPPLQLICDALTTQYLRPMLIANGMPEEKANSFVIWYDVSDLIVRPNKSADAVTLHGLGVLSDAALRAATGFDESDAPEVKATDPAIELAMTMVSANPNLMLRPGLDVLLAQLQALAKGEPLPSINPDPEAKAENQKTVDDAAATPDDKPADSGAPAESGAADSGAPESGKAAPGAPPKTSPGAPMPMDPTAHAAEDLTFGGIVNDPTLDPYGSRNRVRFDSVPDGVYESEPIPALRGSLSAMLDSEDDILDLTHLE